MKYDLYFELLTEIFKNLFDIKDRYEYLYNRELKESENNEDYNDINYLNECKLKYDYISQIIDSFAAITLKITK